MAESGRMALLAPSQPRGVVFSVALSQPSTGWLLHFGSVSRIKFSDARLAPWPNRPHGACGTITTAGGCVLRFAIASIHWMLASPLLFFLFIIVPLVCAIISWLQRYLLYILFDLNLFIMKKSIVWGVLAVVLLCTTMISCNVPMNKESYVKGFVKFVEDVEANGSNYTLKDWE